MILAVAEHRRGRLRDVTFEILGKGKDLAGKMGLELVPVLLGNNVQELGDELCYWADKVLIVEDDRLENFNSEAYQRVLCKLISEKRALMTLIGHTSFGMELAPSLAAALDLPLLTDCLDLEMTKEGLVGTRQLYGGKLNCRVSIKGEHCIATLRPAAFSATGKMKSKGEAVRFPSPLEGSAEHKRFLGYLEAPVEDVDITQADVIVAVGRGLNNKEDIEMMEELTKSFGGVLACSRAVADKGWLPKERLVGTTGKTVNPRLYIAVGISGAPQHISGMKFPDTTVAINKDPDAPILSVAHYAIIDDLYEIVPLLRDRIKERKQ